MSPCCVLEQDIFTPKRTGKIQEAMAQSEHDCKIVYRDIKHQTILTKPSWMCMLVFSVKFVELHNKNIEACQ